MFKRGENECEVTLMVNEERIKLMVKLASYEEKEGKNDFKISSYYKKDYVSLNVLCTFLWTTVGYAILVGMIGIATIDSLMEKFTVREGILLVGAVVIVYVVMVAAYCIIAHKFFEKKHNQARQRVKNYSHNLLILNRLYEKEKA